MKTLFYKHSIHLECIIIFVLDCKVKTLFLVESKEIISDINRSSHQ